MRHESTRAERLQLIAHLLTAGVLILKGISKLSHPAGYWPLIYVTMIGGSVVLAGALFHHRLLGSFRHFDPLVNTIEGITCLLVGVVSLEHATRYIQYAWFFAGIGFLISAGVMSVKGRAVPREASQDHEKL